MIRTKQQYNIIGTRQSAFWYLWVIIYYYFICDSDCLSQTAYKYFVVFSVSPLLWFSSLSLIFSTNKHVMQFDRSVVHEPGFQLSNDYHLIICYPRNDTGFQFFQQLFGLLRLFSPAGVSSTNRLCNMVVWIWPYKSTIVLSKYRFWPFLSTVIILHNK